MKTKLKDENRNSKDKGVVLACLLLLIMAAAPLLSPDLFNRLFSKNAVQNAGPKIGEIVWMKNDIRQKNAESFAWKTLDNGNKEVTSGDSIFTGKGSNASIAMNDGSTIDLDENSLVTFTTSDDLKLADLSSGNFRLKINGSLNVRIQGQLVKIDGNSAQVQVLLTGKGPPQMRVIQGKASLQTEDGRKLALSQRPLSIQAEVPEPGPSVDLPAQLSRVDQWNDFYEESGRDLHILKNRRELVTASFDVVSLPAESAQLAQLSSKPDFRLSSAVSRRMGQAPPRFDKLYLGANYIRASRDGRHWGPVATLVLLSEALKETPPQLNLEPGGNVYLLEEQATLKIQAPKNFNRSVIEISDHPQFPRERTHASWIPAQGLVWEFREEQTLFLRARGVNAKNEISAYGPTRQVVVLRPPAPSLPRLAQNQIEMQENEPLWIEWSGGSRLTEVRLLTTEGLRVAAQDVQGKTYQIPALPMGEYRLLLTGKDEFGRRTKTALNIPVRVKKPEVPLFLAAEPALPRQPSALSESHAELETPVSTYLNRHYADSRLSIEGAAFTIFSQPQVDQGSQNPTALTGGVRSLHWWGSHGVEGSVKSKVATLAESPDGGVAPLQIEARYHYRFNLPFSPFSSLGSSQISFFNGFEFYRNPVSGPFSPGYQLWKVGTALTFPFISRWDTGGELAYGQGFDRSQKYEVSGFLSYYFDPRLSFGVGYRAHLFNAGSTASSPKELPYREAFGEGYSVMRWTY